MNGSRYSNASRAAAISYAGTDAQAAAATGIERRTISRWRSAYRSNPDTYGPDVRRIVDAATAETIDLTRTVRDTVLAEMLRRAADPRTRASDLAAIYRETRDEAALLEGRATARSESVSVTVNAGDYEMSWSDKEDLRRWLDSLAERMANPEGAAVVVAEVVPQLAATLQGAEGDDDE